ncbi:MAG: O-acetyl-ADP-ribose deacetylase [Myxococcales bacterium]|jgi:O-acetyl-ADP-ribose deacetylase (regulator of RNase III)
MERRYRVSDSEIVLVQGDITRERTDAIANAANSGLLGGGGVDGAIHRAAGPRLLEACREAKRSLPGGRLPTGEAVITPGFDLPARFVIHCVGPVYAREGPEAPRLLASCYQNALRLCVEYGLDSVAFPSISTGIYGYPVDEAAPVALGAVRGHLERERRPALVRFVLFDPATFRAYEQAADAALSAA